MYQQHLVLCISYVTNLASRLQDFNKLTYLLTYISKQYTLDDNDNDVVINNDDDDDNNNSIISNNMQLCSDKSYTYWIAWIAFIHHQDGAVGGNQMSGSECRMLTREHYTLGRMQIRLRCCTEQVQCFAAFVLLTRTPHLTSNKNTASLIKRAIYYNNTSQLQDDCSGIKFSTDMWIHRQLR